EGVGQAVQVADAAQVALQALQLLAEVDLLLLAEAQDGLVLEHGLELAQALDARADGLEVREQAAEPALVDVRHARAARFGRQDLLGLLLGADEQDGAAARGDALQEVEGLLALHQRLLQVDDEDAVALREDVTLHLRVAALGLVTEVHAGFEELLHSEVRHVILRGGMLRLNSVPGRTAGPRGNAAPSPACWVTRMTSPCADIPLPPGKPTEYSRNPRASKAPGGRATRGSPRPVEGRGLGHRGGGASGSAPQRLAGGGVVGVELERALVRLAG